MEGATTSAHRGFGSGLFLPARLEFQRMKATRESSTLTAQGVTTPLLLLDVLAEYMRQGFHPRRRSPSPAPAAPLSWGRHEDPELPTRLPSPLSRPFSDLNPAECSPTLRAQRPHLPGPRFMRHARGKAVLDTRSCCLLEWERGGENAPETGARG